jgi:predicted RNA methylase
VVAVSEFWLTPPDVPDDERLREHEADFTPLPVVRQCVDRACDIIGPRPYGRGMRMCDPAAGAGAWASELRGCGGDEDRVVAIEKRQEEREHLKRHAHEVHICDALQWATRYRGKSFDLTATNPPFTLLPDFVDAFLQISRHVWMFGRVDALVRGKETSEWLRRRAKNLRCVLVVPGAISFREHGSTDLYQYGLWMFEAPEVGPADGWTTILLPRLDGHLRKWKTRPGTEAV